MVGLNLSNQPLIPNTPTFLEREEFKNYDISVLLDPYCHHHLDTYNKINCYFPPTNYDDLSTISDYFDIIIVGGGAHIDDVEITDLSFIPYIALELSIVSIKKIQGCPLDCGQRKQRVNKQTIYLKT